MDRGESMLARHADKGKWEINEEELKSVLPADQAEMVMSALQANMGDKKEIALKLDGVKRALKLGEEVYKSLPREAFLFIINSGKERAQLTSDLAAERINQLVGQHNDKANTKNKRRIDMAQVIDKDLVKLLADSDDSTWGPYGKMVEEGMSEPAAIARWLNDMNAPGSAVPANVHPKESSERYRTLIKILKGFNKEPGMENNKLPISVLGVGHSGSLGQVRYESKSEQFGAEDVPDFGEIHIFSGQGDLLATKKVAI